MVSQERRASKKRATTTKETKPAEPLRTCVGCRAQFAPTMLLRVVMDPDGVTPRLDYLAKLPGRGAYMCPNPRCIQQAVQRGGLKRAFKLNANLVTTPESLMTEAFSASRRQLLALVALAGRAGHTAAGTSRVENCLRNQEGGLLILASDSSAGVQRKYRQWAERNRLPVYVTLTKAELGSATGLPEASLMIVVDPGFTRTIELEVQRAGQLVPDAAGPVPSA